MDFRAEQSLVEHVWTEPALSPLCALPCWSYGNWARESRTARHKEDKEGAQRPGFDREQSSMVIPIAPYPLCPLTLSAR